MSYIIFLIQCPDQKGLVARISGFFYQRGFNILHCQQHTDSDENRFFMRLKLDLAGVSASRETVATEFAAFAAELKLEWSVYYSDCLQRIAIFVSHASHCLYDLLLRQQEGELACEIPLIISNHATLARVAEKFDIPFHHVPIVAGDKPSQEAAIRSLIKEYRIDVLVLARYMQILSPGFVHDFAHRVINIHHAFLPAFQGANPYQRAYAQGVKMIGATAHYATAELDVGPIIEQDVERVTHEDAVEDLRRIGKDIERLVLARAVKAHLERRIIVTGQRAVVFSTGV